LELKLKDTKTWRMCVGAISSIVDEAVFDISPDGVRLRAMDASHVALADLELTAKEFDVFSAEKPLSIGVSLSEINKVLFRAKPDDEMTIEFDEKTNLLTMTFVSSLRRRFRVPVIDARKETLSTPTLKHTATAAVVAGTIMDGLKDAMTVGEETVQIRISEEGVQLSSEGDRGTSELRLEAGSANLLGLKVNSPARAKYNVGYLNKIIAPCPPREPIKLAIGTDLPIQVDYPIANGKLQFLLAPRVEDSS